jgi:capsid protein
MNLLRPALDLLSKFSSGPRRSLAQQPRPLRAKYDAAQTTSENIRHWGNADQYGLTSDQMNNKQVRITLKVRSRYEYNNGGYNKRIINKTSNEVVGKKIKVNIESTNPDFNQSVERDMERWQREIQLEKKLRTLVKEKMREGEALALPYTNERLKSSVKLDLATISSDRLTSPESSYGVNDNNVDGVILDGMGINPVKYQIARTTGTYSNIGVEFDTYDANKVYHWFEKEYAEQHRGIPELTSTLDINAARRAYSKSVLSTAQLQSNFAMFLQQSVTNYDEDPIADMTEFDLERNTVTIMPPNAEVKTVNASQPIDTFKEFNDQMIMEMAAPGNVPHNIVKGSSADMNYSSARFDYYIMFGKDRDIIRSDMEREILDDIIMQYIEEWSLLNSAQFPAGMPDGINITYGYEVDKYINPLQEAKADALTIKKNEDGVAMRTLKDYNSAQGKDWKEVITQQIQEEKFTADLRFEVFGDETEDDNGDKNNE